MFNNKIRVAKKFHNAICKKINSNKISLLKISL